MISVPDDTEIDTMCKEMEALFVEFGEEIREEGHEEGAMNAKMEMAITLSEMGIPINKIAQAVKMDIDTVAQWIDGGAVAVK